MRALIFCLLFLIDPAFAQGPWQARSLVFVGGAPPSYVGPGDVSPTVAKMFVGVQAYTAAIAAAGTQHLMSYIRTADSHICDVLPATNGFLGNTASCSTGGDNGQPIATFCTTGCTIVGAYDQISNTPLSGTMLALFSGCSSGSLPCFGLNGTSNTIALPIITVSSPITLICACLEDSTGGAAGEIIRYPADVILRFTGGGASSVGVYSGTLQNLTGVADNAWHAVIGIAGSSGSINVDGASSGTVNTGTQTISGAGYLGSFIAVSDFWKGRGFWVGVWQGAFSGGDISAMNSNIHTNGGF